MNCKYLVSLFLIALCANANAEWFLRGTHNAWAVAQMESAGAGTNTMQLKGVVFTAAGSVKFDRFGDWKESYGVGGRGGSNIPIAAGTWDIKFFTDSKTWNLSAIKSSIASASAQSSSKQSSSKQSSSKQASSTKSSVATSSSSAQASSSPSSIYHVRGTFNDWLEGTLMHPVDSNGNYQRCVNFIGANSRFKIDPNGGWGDGIPAESFAVNAGWVKINFNRATKNITVQQNLASNCQVPSSSSLGSTSSSSVSSSSSSDVNSTRFAVIGDYGWAAQTTADVAALVKRWSPDLVLTAGDNNYPDGLASTLDPNVGQYYSDFIAPYTGQFGTGGTVNRFYPALGNHDWNTGSIQPYLDYFTLPGNERYYDVVHGPVHIFILNSDPHEPDGVSAQSVQAQWLRNQLSASSAVWKIVVMHHAPYSSGGHGSTVSMRWPFKEWGVDAVIAGHDHHYERLYANGVTYLVNGLGGRSLHELRSKIPESHFRYGVDFGALLVEASNTVASFKFVQRTGTTLDHFTLSKGFKQNLPYVFFRGTANAWGNTPMRLIGDNKWQIDVTFGIASTERFKFDVYGDWTQPYGDGNRDFIGDGGDPIPITQGAGKYRIEFNDVSKRYSVQRLATQ